MLLQRLKKHPEFSIINVVCVNYCMEYGIHEINYTDSLL